MFEYLGLKTLQLKEPYDFEVEWLSTIRNDFECD